MENQPTTLDKAVKVSIIAGALIIALSIGYYFVVFLPQKEKTKIEQQAQEKKARIECAEWALNKAQDKAGRQDRKYAKEDYDGYFARCLREKGL